MEHKIERCTQTDFRKVAATCPHCGREGIFEEIHTKDITDNHFFFGQRRCPNPSCHGHIFFISTTQGVQVTYPAQSINFEKQGIPEKVLSVFEEAVICHANQCFVASAIMIRKTLEEICKERGVTEGNLKERIQALSDRITINKELFEGMHELRLLGNDAAHFESRAFNKIEKEEVEVGLEFAKEILKAVYQYDQLLKRMKGLRKNDTNPQV